MIEPGPRCDDEVYFVIVSGGGSAYVADIVATKKEVLTRKAWFNERGYSVTSVERWKRTERQTMDDFLFKMGKP